MIDQLGSKRDWSSLIEEDSHLRGRAILILDFGEALLDMLKHGRKLLGGDAGKPFQELISRRAGFQVLKESLARAREFREKPRRRLLCRWRARLPGNRTNPKY